MPKQTFFNLPAEKRERIIEISLEEFSTKFFDVASLSKIVEKAKIAKGSMYQYFESKKELYKYLVKYVSEKKLLYINSSLPEDQEDFFLLYKDIIFAAARFDINHPLYSSFLYNVGKDTNNPDLSKNIMSDSTQFIKSLLVEAYEKGQIRKDVNVDLASFIISYLSVDIGEYIGNKYGYSYHSVLQSQTGQMPVTDKQLEDILDELIDFFKRGIANI